MNETDLMALMALVVAACYVLIAQGRSSTPGMEYLKSQPAEEGAPIPEDEPFAFGDDTRRYV